MTYRIRYRTPGSGGSVEAIVDANSPNEAVVKFRCAGTGAEGEAMTSEILSVQPESFEPVNW